MIAVGAESVAAASDPQVRALSELQFVLGEGPARDAFDSGAPVLVADLERARSRWVAFSSAALAAGTGGAYAFPLGAGAARLGSLVAYTAPGERLDQRALVLCLRAAGTAYAWLLTSDDGLSPSPDVLESIRPRAEVYQAQGIASVALGLSLTDALVWLRATAYAEDLDLNQLATDIVAGRRRLHEQGESP